MRLIDPKVSINYILDTRYTKKTGTYTIKLRVTYLGNRLYLTTSIDLTKEDFDLMIGGSSKGYLRDIRYKLDKEVNAARQVADTMQSFNFSEFKRLLRVKGKPQSLEWYFEDTIVTMEEKLQDGTLAHYKTALNVFKEFFGKHFDFLYLTPVLLEKFENHYFQQKKSLATVGTYMRALRAVYNRALRDHVINEFDYPFGKDKYIIPSIRKRKVGIAIEYIKEIHNFEFIDPFKQFHRDLWLFSFHCNGMNMKDIAFLTFAELKDNKLVIYREKTKRTRKRQQTPLLLHLNEHARAIIERWGNEKTGDEEYIFPILDHSMTPDEKRKRYRQASQNTRLLVQRLAKEKGWPFKINFQSARHSFGNLLQKDGQPLHVIQQAYNHSDPMTTLHYLQDLDEEKQNEISTLTNYTL